jgi:hypothetical protein
MLARFVVSNAQLDWDEELYWQIGEAWRHGGTPYADLFDHKPPLLYVPQVLYSGFTGSIVVLRVVATLVLAGSAAFFGRSMWPGRSDLAAMLSFLVLLTLSSFGCIGSNSEILYAPYVLFTGGLLLRGALLPAVLTAAIAVNLKYTVAFDITGVALFAHLAGRLPRARTLVFLVASGVTTLAVWLALYGYFRSHGVDIFDTTIIANLFHAADQRKPFLATLGTYAVTRFVIVSVGLLLAARLLNGPVDRGVRNGLLIWAGAALLQATITGKTFYHYFTPVYLPLCVLVVARWDHAASRLHSFGLLLGAASALTLFAQAALVQGEFGTTRDRLMAEVCPALEGQSVYVADEFIATYRICGSTPSKYMFPPFIFHPHNVTISGSRGLEELADFDRVVISEGSRFEVPVRSIRRSGVVQLPAIAD